MTWTDRDDASACCDGELGFVKSDESLARLLHSGITEPTYEPFRRSDLFPRKKQPINNTCGDADGCSVVRRDGLDDERLFNLAESLVQTLDSRKLLDPARRPLGAVIAKCAELRSIKIEGYEVQLVFVYDDPSDEEPCHAVIRGSDILDRPEQEALREEITKRFADRVSALRRG